MKFLHTLAAILFLPGLSAAQSTQPAAPTRPLVVGYAPNWVNNGDTAAFAANFPWEKVTHINIAFENPVDDEGNLSWSPADDALVAAAHAHNVKVSLSIGGGAASGDKALLARNEKLLAAPRMESFVKKLSALATDKHLDGIDIDIEGPAINPGYPGFIETLALDLHAKHLLLTAAISEGYGGEKIPRATLQHFDYLHIMAYDGTGYWNPNHPGQHSSFEMAQKNVAWLISRGVTPSHITLGLPFYGYGFGHDFKKRDYPYADIVATHPGAENTDTTGDTIYYNGIKTIQTKTAWALDQGLAGVMIWSLDTDAPFTSEKSLLSAIHQVASTRPSK